MTFESIIIIIRFYLFSTRPLHFTPSSSPPLKILSSSSSHPSHLFLTLYLRLFLLLTFHAFPFLKYLHGGREEPVYGEMLTKEVDWRIQTQAE